MCWASARCKSQRGGIWRGMAWLFTVEHGGVRTGRAGQGQRWQHGGPTGLPCRLHWWTGRGQDWRGDAWLGEVGFGEVRHGWARVTDGGTEAPASLPPSRGWTARGAAWRGWVGQATERPGMVRRGKGCRQQHGASTEAPCCSLWRADVAGYGELQYRWLRRGWVMQCSAWRGKG